MPSRSDKQEKLRHNVEASAERATRAECQKLKIGRQSPRARYIYKGFRKEFEQSAIRVDRTKLHEVWNG